MVKKSYDWQDNQAKLETHSRKKHEILKKYFKQYLATRCQNPHQEKFKLAIVDGFCGAGTYKCGSYGSPLIFVDCLIESTVEICAYRQSQNFRMLVIECELHLNDSDTNAVEILKKNLSPLIVRAREICPQLMLNIHFSSSLFKDFYPDVVTRIHKFKTHNVIFNLDQCGYSHVTAEIIRDIMGRWRSAEVLLTFMIDSLLTYLSPRKNQSSVPLAPEIQEKVDLLINDESLFSKKHWLGEAEKIVFRYLQSCAIYVTPFSINNPDGWRYWLMHFANAPRARQVFNDILHQDGALQAHFGKPGLNMLSYDPQYEGQLYLFDEDSRKAAIASLAEDIPRLVSENGNEITMSVFYEKAYRETPAHSDDIHQAMLESAELEIYTETGGKRRTAKSIKKTDILRLNKQRILIFSS